ncbi:hypothetical protein L202_00570 [Cryptococcus amylolentus CBS 6039]|uniref:Uncharacterized protein n=1 Tax=Cryptococcus amylolentus CBS 6039 TaxID=1295533 RepID=A0A1E3I7J2_9TREE|nr:hypothetical protein L202_00570 [Cryptococcus amylolentus CBS 6039]ODN84673.1 hypothetical protein L202_00570 [Cryptococcus amylolentus CBS 6039]
MPISPKQNPPQLPPPPNTQRPPTDTRQKPPRRVPRPLAPPGQHPSSAPSPPRSPDHPRGQVPPPVPSSPYGRTLAEAYADAHSHPHPHPHPSTSRTPSHAAWRPDGHAREKKPIFDWITRKLTTARRTTISSHSTQYAAGERREKRSRLASMPRARGLGLSNTASHDSQRKREISMPPMTRADTLPSVSFSLDSAANTVERDRRREANNPYPSLPLSLAAGHNRHNRHLDAGAEDTTGMSMFSGTVSLSGEGSMRETEEEGGNYSRRSSRSAPFERDTHYSAVSGHGGSDWPADDDASLRPFPPSARGSPTQSSFLSRSTSVVYHKHLRASTLYSASSDGADLDGRDNEDGDAEDGDESSGRRVGRRRISRDGSTSTKPTTCISYDSGLGVAHIAHASIPPAAPSTASHTTPVFPIISPPVSPQPPPIPNDPLVHAPPHTPHHPSYNPHPSSSPDPNASTLTLASSSFALPPPPGQRRSDRPSSLVTSPSIITWAEPTSAPLSPPYPATGDRPLSVRTSTSYAHSLGTGGGHLSLHAPSISMSLRGLRGIGGAGPSGGFDGRADGDASVRAVRRKGSWESNESGWSWRGAAAAAVAQGQGPASVTERDGTELERVLESPRVIDVK